MRLSKNRIVTVVVCVLVILATNVLAFAGKSECISSGWPSERSDLKPDPALSRGTLANGFRYVVMENHEPKDRVALYLFVDAGSLHEQDDQRGVAHFLEHMLFNGTTHFPPGELVRFFQEIGMSFGGDTNAHTSYDETVYNVLLPDGTEDNLRKGFLVMADYARGALLLEDEVNRERQVILAERRSRDSAGYRAFVKGTAFKYRGTLLPERQVIGDEGVLQSADRSLLKRYYDGWYRPENMMLVVVGDIVPAQVIPLIAESFSPLRGEGEAPPCPEIGAVDHSGGGVETFYLHEKELGRTEVSIETIFTVNPVEDSSEVQAEELYRYVSILAMNNRLKKIQEKESEILTGVGYYSSDMLDTLRYATITAGASDKTWQQNLGLLDTALRQALIFGFTQQEIDRVAKDLLTSLETAVLTAKSRDSEKLGRQIIRQFNENRVFLSPEQERELYSAIINSMTVADINTFFRKNWSSGNMLISVQGDAVISGENPEKTILQLYNELSSRQLLPYTEEAMGQFPYLLPQDGATGKRIKHERLSDIGVERLVFANNVSVTFKKTDFEPNAVRMVVDVGQGKLSEPYPGLAMLAEKVVNDSGTATMAPSALADILSGTTVNVQFGVREESLRYTARSVKSEIELLMQLLYSLLQDPGFREQAYSLAQNELQQMYDRLNSDIQGAYSTKVDRFLAGGNPHIGLPPLNQVTALELQQVRDWLLPQLRQGSMEIAIVGDFDLELVKTLVGKYFGTLPERQVASAESAFLLFPAGQKLETEVDSSIEKSLVIVAWPTAGFWNIHMTRRMAVLADIFQERLRLVIREKLGASYAPMVFSAPSRVYGDYGRLQAQVVVEPGREQEILGEIVKVAEQLRTESIAAEELERAKGPLITALKDSVRTNDYWLYSVLANSTRHPQLLGWPVSLLSDISGIQSGEIEDLAKTYLQDEKKATAVVHPTKRKP